MTKSRVIPSKEIITLVLKSLICFFLKCYTKKSRRARLLSQDNHTFVPYAADQPPKLHLFHNEKLLIYKAFQDVRYNQIRVLGAMYLDVNMSVVIKVNGKRVRYKREIHGLVINFNIQFPLKYVNFVFPDRPVNKITVNDV